VNTGLYVLEELAELEPGFYVLALFGSSVCRRLTRVECAVGRSHRLWEGS
jgi:hypothetical protein